MHSTGRNITVVGAGAFGGWTALELQRRGASVTLVDMARAGNPLSSSGGESRVLRHIYPKRIYVDLAARALELWKQADRDWGQELFHPKGVLFMSAASDFIDQSRLHMDAAGVAYENLDRAQLVNRYPQVNPEGLEQALFEPSAGYIDANRSCAVVREAFLAAGGRWRCSHVKPGPVHGDEMHGLVLADGETLRSELLVFACGPWLKRLFPSLLGPALSITRQEVYFFRIPAGHEASLGGALPVWAEVGEKFWYGIPGPDGLFKLADDTKGREVDPDTQSREASAAGVAAAQHYMASRFPGMAGAQLADARVCQYSMTPDHDFILDWHPEAGNALIMGGGSGHGFKHGPALGELAADIVLAQRSPPREFAISRWPGAPA